MNQISVYRSWPEVSAKGGGFRLFVTWTQCTPAKAPILLVSPVGPPRLYFPRMDSSDLIRGKTSRQVFAAPLRYGLGYSYPEKMGGSSKAAWGRPETNSYLPSSPSLPTTLQYVWGFFINSKQTIAVGRCPFR